MRLNFSLKKHQGNSIYFLLITTNRYIDLIDKLYKIDGKIIIVHSSYTIKDDIIIVKLIFLTLIQDGKNAYLRIIYSKK